MVVAEGLMDFNTQHQTWSRWAFRVKPGRQIPRSFAEVKVNCARFGRKAFGAASQMNVAQHRNGDFLIMVRTEGHPAHDLSYVEYMARQWKRFFESGFGAGTVVRYDVRFEAGDRQDGSPREQLIVLPPLTELVASELGEGEPDKHG